MYRDMKANIFVKEIYINNKPLILTNAAEKFISKNSHAAGFLLLSGAFTRNFRLAKKHLESLSSTGALIHDLSPEALEQMLAEQLIEIKAAGGLVQNGAGELLLIYRRGHWDLPKGKIDEGESEQEGALREVREETGLKNLTAGEKLATTYHVYDHEDQSILKTTDWYAMESKQREKLTPQLEEDILIARWVGKQEASALVKNSYSIVRNLVERHYLR